MRLWSSGGCDFPGGRGRGSGGSRVDDGAGELRVGGLSLFPFPAGGTRSSMEDEERWRGGS